jgi:hypothetical protein
VVSAPPPAEDDEPPPLAPSTPAGARPRFPPAPEVRAEPVGAAARVSGRTLGAAALGDAGGAATTRRRERERERVRIEDDDDPPRGSAGSTLRLVGAAIVIAAVLIFVAIKVIGGGSSTPPGSPTNSTHTNNATGPSPSTVTVAVLNGTQTKGLATRVSAVFVGKGFLKGVVGNAPSPNHTTTLVSYTTGNRAAAREVAKDLAPIKPRVGPVDAATAAVADAHGAPPNVVVTLGSDYSQR